MGNTNKKERKESATPSEGGMSGQKLKQEEMAASKDTNKQANTLDKDDLDAILDVLRRRNYGARNYNSLGLALGLLHNDIGDIEAVNHKDVKGCLRDVLALWLKEATDENPATWQKLVNAVKRDDKAAAEKIEQEKIKDNPN